MPTDIQVPPALIENLWRRIVEWDNYGPAEPESLREVLHSFFTEHRLVRLPEEPERWEVERGLSHVYWHGPFSETSARSAAVRTPMSTGRIRKHYAIYGPPETVTSEEES